MIATGTTRNLVLDVRGDNFHAGTDIITFHNTGNGNQHFFVQQAKNFE